MKKSKLSQGQAPMVAWRNVRKEIGISEATAWRWRKKGWLRTIEIGGRQYICQEELERFKSRLLAGEFSSKSTSTKEEGQQ